jgi:5-methylcytosine-specific restriction endonuclease McrA
MNRGTEMPLQTKICCTCRRLLSVDSYYAAPKTKDGLYRRCKDCHNAATRRWRAENIEKHTASVRAWQAAHPDIIRAAIKKHRASGKHLAVRRLWRARNHDRVIVVERAGHRKFAAQNPDKIRAYKHRRRVREKSGDHFTDAQISNLYEKQRGKCAVCFSRLGAKYHIDHVVPLVAGGANSIDNIQLLCVPCNLSKGGKDPIVFRQQRGMLL